MPPEAFTGTPSLEDVIYAVNANTQRIEQLQTDSATLRADSTPALRANLVYQRPLNLRLQAQLSQFTGQELDLGSNDELFWFWVKRDQHPAVYYSRYSEFATSGAQEMIPLQPNRLIDTLGLVYLDPQGRHQGPMPKDPNLLEVRSSIPGPRGDITRLLLVDAKYGWIVEQHYYDPGGQLLLSSRASRHRFYPEDAVSMPHHVEVTVLPGQPTQMAFEIDVNRYVFNRLTGQAAELFALPRIDGVPTVNVADPQFRMPVANDPGTALGATRPYGQLPGGGLSGAYGLTTPGGQTQGVYGPPRTASVPAYRGYENALR